MDVLLEQALSEMCASCADVPWEVAMAVAVSGCAAALPAAEPRVSVGRLGAHPSSVVRAGELGVQGQG